MTMSDWRVAGSLLVLREQINALYPGRNKSADGTIGDAAHQGTTSDHNPDAQGVVRALDITHDPYHGCDIGQISDALAASRDGRISYVIANRLITGPNYGWSWSPYSGSDPHTGHIHISVVGDARADNTQPWSLGGSDVALSDQDLKAITQNVAAALRKGSWRDGYNDSTFDVAYRGGPTLASLEEQLLNARTAIADVRALVADRPDKPIDYQALAKALLVELGK